MEGVGVRESGYNRAWDFCGSHTGWIYERSKKSSFELQETICDMINSFPEIDQLVDNLYTYGLATQNGPTINDTLSNQLDRLEACKISLNSKMASIDKIEDNQVSANSRSNSF